MSSPDKPALKIDWCTYAAAKYAVENWHYSKAMPVSKNLRVGVWESSKFVGCVIYAQGGNLHIGDPYGLTQTETAELVRVALTAHGTPVSRVLSIAGRFLRKSCPGLRLLVSYADQVQGHHGGIYQAAGWVYVGQTMPSYEFRLNGKRLQKRAYTGANFGHGRLQLPSGAVRVSIPGKHKYLMPLDAAMRAQIAPLAKPYPKRPGTGTRDGTPVEVGGSTPTPGLR
jgi:hypothetical protein